MPRKCLLLVGVLLALSAACNRETTPPPKFAEVMDGPGNRKLVPITVPDRKDESLLGAMAAVEQPAAAKERDSGAEGIKIDDSSPVALARSMQQMASAMDWNKLPDVLVPEQAESMRGMIDSVAPFLAATGEFHKALADKLAGAPIALEVKDAWLQQLVQLSGGLNVEDAPAAEGEEAQVSLTVGPADAADAKKLQWTAKKENDAWKLAIPDFEAPADPAVVATELEGKTAGFKDLAKRIESEDLQDADATKAEVDKVMSGEYKPTAGDEAAAEANAEPEKAQADQPIPERRRRDVQETDATDGVISSPTLRRGN